MRDPHTIAAVATAAGRAGIGVVRVSGRRLDLFAHQLTGQSLAPRQATLTTFRDANGKPIDQGIGIYFAAPASYTGEDVLELQGHGGAVVLRLLLQRCLELGARVAEPGEFTRRAFLNGKLDLAQAESVVDLIEATTTQAARCAVRSLQGDFSGRIGALTQSIIELRALVEATLDFPEEDVEALQRNFADERLSGVRAALHAVLGSAQQGSLMREGLNVVLAGKPNVGKSSLLNRLVGEEVAIVTEMPGTTRDPIRETVDIEGVPVRVIDTAGLRDSCDPVERIGVERAWKAIVEADAVVMLVDAADGEAVPQSDISDRLPLALPRIRAMNKIDLLGRPPALQTGTAETVVWLSAKTGDGLDLLKQAILALAGWQGDAEGSFLARERHLVALRRADHHLNRASKEVARLELFAEELRLAQDSLGAITGEYSADDLLGEIFSRFCIGK